MAAGYRKGKLVEIELASIGGGHWLEKDAAAAYLRMYEAAKADGITLVANSAFRTHGKQWLLYEEYQRQLKLWDEGKRAGKPSVVATPGWSNHEGGLAVDINRAPGDDPATTAPDSPVDRWLSDNAAKFGFVRTVPSEAWHWEYRPEIAKQLLMV